MAILNWIFNNWDNIVVAFALIVLGFISGVRLINKLKAMTNEERIAFVKRLLENLSPVALSLVTKAEETYGRKTGLLKRSEVLDELYSRIPDEFKPYVTEANLDAILQQALDIAKKEWEQYKIGFKEGM